MQRREFLRFGAVAAAGVASSGWPIGNAIAGPFFVPRRDEFPIPADKKFDQKWIASLSARGEPTVYRSRLSELDFIGMPIGGICCGQVYLGGDGTLWHWDIFNLPQTSEWSHTSGPLYAKPARQASPIQQGFSLRITGDGVTQDRRLDTSGFSDIEFRGQYPIGIVRYSDAASPVRVELEAFSPFCPLDEASSGTPAIVMSYTVTNTSDRRVEAAIGGWLENPVCKQTGQDNPGRRISRVLHERLGGVEVTTLECSARSLRPDEQSPVPTRPDVVFEDWERGTYDGWTKTGTAFGDRPRNLKDIAAYQGNLEAQGNWTVNTHESRHGETVVGADAHIGTLTSRAFTIERPFISFRIGGGKHPGQTCVNLLVDGAVVRTATGLDNNRMRFEYFDVKEFAGREAQIQIVDGWTGAWGQIGCDEIVFCEQPRRLPYEMDRAPDFGSMSLSVLGPASHTGGRAAIKAVSATTCFETSSDTTEAVESPFDTAASAGCVSHRGILLEPGESKTVRFVIAWWFPNPDRGQLAFLNDSNQLRRWYAGRFASASDVRTMMISGLDSLTTTTRLWRDTWYDSSLPFWFLDRTFATISTAATATCWRFDNGRFYGWEGTYCCAGTCTHVWQYAQGLARIFPLLERSTRELVDFGLAFHDESGQIDYRAEAARELAVDGQCGTILRAYREHQMSVLVSLESISSVAFFTLGQTA